MVNFAFQDVEHPYPHNTLTPADFKDKGWAAGPTAAYISCLLEQPNEVYLLGMDLNSTTGKKASKYSINLTIKLRKYYFCLNFLKLIHQSKMF